VIIILCAQERSAVQNRGNDDTVDDHHVHVHDTRAAAAATAAAATTTVLPAVPSSTATGAVRRTQGHAAGIRSGPEAQTDVPEAQARVRVLLRGRLRRPAGVLRRERGTSAGGQETHQETFQAQQ